MKSSGMLDQLSAVQIGRVMIYKAVSQLDTPPPVVAFSQFLPSCLLVGPRGSLVDRGEPPSAASAG